MTSLTSTALYSAAQLDERWFTYLHFVPLTVHLFGYDDPHNILLFFYSLVYHGFLVRVSFTHDSVFDK